jgi:hypothetical protein
MNPYDGLHLNRGVSPELNTPDEATAFCDNYHDYALSDISTAIPVTCGTQGTPQISDYPPLHFQEELYLIDASGIQKTMLALEKIGTNVGPDGATGGGDDEDEFTLSMVRMDGSDKDDDGIRETWQCAENFNCTWCDPDPSTCASGTSVVKPDRSDIGDYIPDPLFDSSDNTFDKPASPIGGNDFVPLSPFDINVTSITFVLTPLEDPHKAWSETGNTMDYVQIQPYVTVIMTVKPSYDVGIDLWAYADFPEISIQTTVSSRVYREVKSFDL